MALRYLCADRTADQCRSSWWSKLTNCTLPINTYCCIRLESVFYSSLPKLGDKRKRQRISLITSWMEHYMGCLGINLTRRIICVTKSSRLYGGLAIWRRFIAAFVDKKADAEVIDHRALSDLIHFSIYWKIYLDLPNRIW